MAHDDLNEAQKRAVTAHLKASGLSAPLGTRTLPSMGQIRGQRVRYAGPRSGREGSWAWVEVRVPRGKSAPPSSLGGGLGADRCRAVCAYLHDRRSTRA